MKKFLRRTFVFACVFLLLAVCLYMGRTPILRAMGNHLIIDDPISQPDAIFQLSSLPHERSLQSAKLYKQHQCPVIVTGELINFDLHYLGLGDFPQSYISYRAALENGVDSTHLEQLSIGTSTFDESEAILGFCDERNYKRIVIVSSAFHTRRIRSVFKNKFADRGIDVMVSAAPPTEYKMDEWWTSEEALIFVANEYIKAVYYMLKY